MSYLKNAAVDLLLQTGESLVDTLAEMGTPGRCACAGIISPWQRTAILWGIEGVLGKFSFS